MKLEGGIQASYMQCHFAPGYCRNYTIIGIDNRIENLDDTPKVIFKRRKHPNRGEVIEGCVLDVSLAKGGHGGVDPIICKDFIDMLIDGKRPVATPLAGRMSVAAACAATSSLGNGWKPE